MRYHVLCSLAFAFVGVATLHDARAQNANGRFNIGDRAPASAVATFVAGPWSERKSHSACPVLLNRQHAKVAVYVRKTSEEISEILQAVDRVAGTAPELKWSFVFVSHENSPTPSDQEYESLLNATAEFALKHEISNLSFGVMKQVAEGGRRLKQKLGFVAEDELVIMLITPDSTESKSGRVRIRYAQVLKIGELNSASVKAVVQDIESIIAKYRQAPALPTNQ